MELAAEYDRPLFGTVRWAAYGGPVGEPALGTSGVPPSHLGAPEPPFADRSPLARLDAHQLRRAHGRRVGPRWKVEGSVFNGREPDERRYDFDFAALDSVAGRLWFLPIPSVALQVSVGRLNRSGAESCGRTPSGRRPLHDVSHVPSSIRRPVISGRRPSHGALTGNWGKTTAWDLAESAVSFSGRHTWFGRAEVNGKPADDLHVHEFRQVFTVGKLQGGYTRYFAPRRGLIPGIGATVSAALVPEALEPRYGGVGTGVGVFVTLRPPLHEMVQ